MPSDPSSRDALDSNVSRAAALVRELGSASVGVEDSHVIYHDDAILEFPQSGERFIGKHNFMEWRRQYPGEVRYRIRRITGSGDVWVNELLISYGGGPWTPGVAIVTFRGDKIAREAIYVTAPWEAADWRARWATRFDPDASIDPADWTPGLSFGLEADLERALTT
jgi:SnoaL-like protein